MPRKVPKSNSTSKLRAFRRELYEAVSQKNHKKLQDLVNRSNINKDAVKNWDSDKTALDLAVIRGDVISIKILLTSICLHHWPEDSLFKAIIGGKLEIIKLLLDFWYPNDIAEGTESMWEYIIESENVPIFQLLNDYMDSIKNQSNINFKKLKELLLFQAFLKKSSGIVEYLLDQGVSVDSTDDDGWTCLFYAVKNSRLSDVKMLIARGANYNHKDNFNRGIFQYATSREIIDCLLDLGVPVDNLDGDGWTFLFHAVADFRLSDVQMLIDKGANVHRLDTYKKNLLHIAVRYHHENFQESPKVIQLLIDHGVDINGTDIFNSTPIHLAFDIENRKSDDVMCLFLRQPGIDLTIPDREDLIILHLLVCFGSIKVLKELLYKPNLDLKILEKIVESPYCAKAKRYYFPIIENFNLLLEFGIDTDILDHFYQMYLRYELKNPAIECFIQYQLKRSIAKLSEDEYVKTVLAENVKSSTKDNVFAEEKLTFSSEIKRMKKTKLYGEMTFYDFLHAEKLTCISIANKPGMREMFTEPKHKFEHYEIMLARNYWNGLRITPIESKAIDSVDHNLNVLFNGKLPSLVIHKIKHLIGIQDIITLEDMKL